MPLLAIVLVVVLFFVAIRSGHMAPPQARTLIRVRNGQVQVSRGHLPSRARQFVQDILHDAGVSSGYIAVTSADAVAFSKTIPPHIRQRLRNVLLNQ